MEKKKKTNCNNRSCASSDEGLQLTSALREVSHCIKNPCQCQWINDGLTKTAPAPAQSAHFETFKMSEVIRKKWTLSLINHACLGRVCLGSFELPGIMRDCDIPDLSSQEAAADFALNFGLNSSLLNILHFYFWGDPRGRWVSPISTGVILSPECHWVPTKDQCDGLLKWTEF